jgi:hypothetical protein
VGSTIDKITAKLDAIASGGMDEAAFETWAEDQISKIGELAEAEKTAAADHLRAEVEKASKAFDAGKRYSPTPVMAKAAPATPEAVLAKAIGESQAARSETPAAPATPAAKAAKQRASASEDALAKKGYVVVDDDDDDDTVFPNGSMGASMSAIKIDGQTGKLVSSAPARN